MTIAWSSIAYAHEANACSQGSAVAFSLCPRLRVRIEIYLYIEGLPGVRKSEYLEQLRFFNSLPGKRTFLEAGKGMSDSGFVDF
jgi:hypothetical protein